MKGRELVFDLDGTISDPSLGIARSVNYALDAYGLEPIADDGIRDCIGPPIDEAFRKLAPDFAETDILGLVARFRERYSEIGYSENVVYAGVPDAIEHLARGGARLGVCTTKRADFAERILDLFGIRGCFEFVSGGDVGVQKREQLQALRAAGSISTAALMIGDRFIDVEAAHATGLEAVGVLWGFGTKDELVAAGADLLLSRPAQLEGLGRGERSEER